MAEYPGFTSVSMQPDPKSKGQDCPPPYPGVPFPVFQAPYALPPCHTVSQDRPPESVQLLVPTAPPPRDYVLWSLFNTMFCNVYCLGFAALIFSVKSRDRLVMGDIAMARRYGITARSLNISVVCVSIVTMVMILITVGMYAS